MGCAPYRKSIMHHDVVSMGPRALIWVPIELTSCFGFFQPSPLVKYLHERGFTIRRERPNPSRSWSVAAGWTYRDTLACSTRSFKLKRWSSTFIHTQTPSPTLLFIGRESNTNANNPIETWLQLSGKLHRNPPLHNTWELYYGCDQRRRTFRFVLRPYFAF